MLKMKERYVWLIFISLLVVGACSNMASGDNEKSEYDSGRGIQEQLDELDDDNEILYGKKVFDDTKQVVPGNVGNKLSCMSCHAEGGLGSDSPMVGITEKFPTMRRGEFTTIEDRINGCFVRSMNGKKLNENSREMEALVAYFEFISQDVESEDDINWRMTNSKDKVPEPDVSNGEELFTKKNCIDCHASDGSGTSDHTGPQLWGDGSFNEAAGMTKIEKTAGFIQNNMPKGKAGTLTDQESADLAAYLLSHDRPSAGPKVSDYHLSPDRTYITQDRREKIRNGNFDWTTLDVIIPKEENNDNQDDAEQEN